MIDFTEFFTGDALETVQKRRAAGEPDAYIIGRAWFYREEYEVSPAVLIPRPDTERLVEALVQALPRGGSFYDLCCGSGCVGISTLCERTDCTAVGCDISAAAVDIARRNAQKNGVADRYRAVVADLHEFPDGGVDIIAANPPYIPSATVDTLDRSVIGYEPRIALDGGADGLDFYRLILDRFSPRVCWLFEIGYDQREGITALAHARGLSCTVTRDYGGNDRVALVRRP